jgi:translation initiation factor IF-1
LASEVDGVVAKTLPQGLYEIDCDNGKKLIASFGGQARRVTVRIQPGDRVRVRVSPNDPSRGSIQARLK